MSSSSAAANHHRKSSSSASSSATAKPKKTSHSSKTQHINERHEYVDRDANAHRDADGDGEAARREHRSTSKRRANEQNEEKRQTAPSSSSSLTSAATKTTHKSNRSISKHHQNDEEEEGGGEANLIMRGSKRRNGGESGAERRAGGEKETVFETEEQRAERKKRERQKRRRELEKAQEEEAKVEAGVHRDKRSEKSSKSREKSRDDRPDGERERRHREKDESKRDQRHHRDSGEVEKDRKSEEKSRSNGHHRDKTRAVAAASSSSYEKRVIPEKPRQQREEDRADEYEDDFENYEDDFEDEEENAEAKQEEEDREEEENRSATRHKFDAPRDEDPNKNKRFINFLSIRSLNASSSRQMKRGFELARLIELEKMSFTLFEMAPVPEYQLYMRGFGRSLTNQTASQTNDDSMSRDCQTDTIEERVVWTQIPPGDDGTNFGIERLPPSYLAGNEYETNNFMYGDAEGMKLSELTAGVGDSRILGISKLAQIMLTLLEEESQPHLYSATSSSTAKSSSSSSSLASSASMLDESKLSLGFIDFSKVPSSLASYLCTGVKFAPSNSNLFISLHQKREKKSAIICVWRVSGSQNEPQAVLQCPSTGSSASSSPNPVDFEHSGSAPITAVTMSPDPSASQVVAGLENGLLIVWDVRESPVLHSNRLSIRVSKKSDRRLIVRSPSFISGTANGSGSHQSAIIQLELLPVPDGGGTAHSSQYQIASLDRSGLIILWTFSYLAGLAGLAGGGGGGAGGGLETDLMLRPGSRVQLSRVGQIDVAALFSNSRHLRDFQKGGFESAHTEFNLDASPSGFSATCFTAVSSASLSSSSFSANQTRAFFVGTQSGHIVHCARRHTERKTRFQHDAAAKNSHEDHTKQQAERSGPTGTLLYPKMFHCGQDNHQERCLQGAQCQVVSLNFSPSFGGGSHDLNYLLAGYRDGTICVFSTKQSRPILRLCHPDSVERSPAHSAAGDATDLPRLQTVKWSPSRPSLLFSLDSRGQLCVWDLLADHHAPVTHVHCLGLRNTTHTNTHTATRFDFELSADSQWEDPRHQQQQQQEQRQELRRPLNQARCIVWQSLEMTQQNELDNHEDDNDNEEAPSKNKKKTKRSNAAVSSSSNAKVLNQIQVHQLARDVALADLDETARISEFFQSLC